MKRFTKLFICLLLCVMSVCLVACDNRSEKDKNFNYPASSGDVYGNGGLAVRKGNCLYYVNGYKTVDSMTEQGASYVLGSLMIAELDANGNVVTDENKVMKNEFINTMTDKLCGFEATNLFIGGDYLYFTTPCQEDESENSGSDPVWAKDRVEFYRIKLDKSSTPEEVYQSTVSYSNLKFEYYYEGGYTYILVYEGGKSKDSSTTDALIRVNTSTKESVVIKENVLSYVFADSADKIFYSFKKDDLYQLNQYNIATNKSTQFTSKEKDFDIVDVKNNKVFISYETSYDFVKSTDLYVANISPKQAFSICVYGIQAYDKTYISEDAKYFVGIKDNKVKIEKLGVDLKLNKVVDADAEKITFVGMGNGLLVYVDNNNIIKSFSYYDYAEEGKLEIKEHSKVEGINTTYLDLDEDYVYFYKTVTNNSYLHRVSLNDTFVEDETNDQMIGTYLDGDAPKVEEKEE